MLFQVFELFGYVKKFYEFFVFFFSHCLYSYLFFYSSLMFVEVDQLIDISRPTFRNFYRPFIYMNELQQSNPFFFETSISEFAILRFYNSLQWNRTVMTSSLFSSLSFKYENKGPYSTKFLYKI